MRSSVLRAYSFARMTGSHGLNSPLPTAPPNSASDTYTIPARDTVAGDALLRFSGSKQTFMFSVMLSRSPLARVSSLLSSRTVFRFSIQIASTGPSQTSQTLCDFFPSVFFVLTHEIRHSAEKIPSCQSPVPASSFPNICEAVIAFGFIRISLCFMPPSRSSMSHSDLSTVWYIIVFPTPAGPTTINPCRTIFVSYSWTHFATQGGWKMRPDLWTWSRSAASSSGYVFFSGFFPGKRSCSSELKRSMSSNTSFDMFMSRRVRMNRYGSSFTGAFRRTDPAVRRTDRMFRSPKS
eukprot:gene19138-biopygen19404